MDIICPMGNLVVIPARLGSTRLPGKPLLEIRGEPLIVHTVAGFEAILTDGGHATKKAAHHGS